MTASAPAGSMLTPEMPEPGDPSIVVPDETPENR